MFYARLSLINYAPPRNKKTDNFSPTELNKYNHVDVFPLMNLWHHEHDFHNNNKHTKKVYIFDPHSAELSVKLLLSIVPSYLVGIESLQQRAQKAPDGVFWNKLACTNIFSRKGTFVVEYTRNHIYSIFQPILIYGGFSPRRTMGRFFVLQIYDEFLNRSQIILIARAVHQSMLHWLAPNTPSFVAAIHQIEAE